MITTVSTKDKYKLVTFEEYFRFHIPNSVADMLITYFYEKWVIF